MITDRMKRFIDNIKDDPDPNRSVKYCVYMNRIQKRIEKELENLLWLCIKHPEIFLDEELEINNMTGKIVSHRRLKQLLLCLKNLNPTMDVELVLKNIRDEKEENQLKPEDCQKAQ